MKMLLKLLIISIVGIMATNSKIIRSAAEPLERFEFMAGSESSLNALVIQNETSFDLKITFKPVGMAEPMTHTVSTQAPDFIYPQNIEGNVTIQFIQPQVERVRRFWQSMPSIKQMIPGFAQTYIPGYQLASLVASNTLTNIANQTITINPRSYPLGTFLVIYWAYWMASINQPPLVLPLAGTEVASIWQNLRKTLDHAMRVGRAGASIAYDRIRNFVAGKRSLDMMQIGTVKQIIRENLPAAQAPFAEGIFKAEGIFGDYSGQQQGEELGQELPAIPRVQEPPEQQPTFQPPAEYETFEEYTPQQ